MGCSGKSICGGICGVLGIVCCVLAFLWDEITRSNYVAGLVTYCGREAYGTCVGEACEKSYLLSETDDALVVTPEDYDTTFKDLCDLDLLLPGSEEGDWPVCQNKMAGQIWFFAMIASAAFAALGVIFLIVPPCKPCGPWALILAAAASAAAVLSFLLVTNVNEDTLNFPHVACMRRGDIYQFQPAISAYLAIGATMMFLTGGIGSCGASKFD
mmetsp:Transcript_17833/g.28140  ORF Transcript_17833/g.28140 Transcript_17833/m.28140 type:complete len:213 (-) Transcript_17833:718-1356(-)|eukprot:CAMPEP_0202685718 /NCGR_PEP_ID=MMETSP1385-20130828/1554_1 /ASSEMBLY_ACC=CAM_ASM_000861 /TAXON_ID=933848 /ORGANISM="Elphidium margaritaceum" /LENGTH=212 /DNA_ID=CAMNT_0049340145 /DNA_START=39 /DNA_END=677 /DNA_ORIENTATION=+